MNMKDLNEFILTPFPVMYTPTLRSLAFLTSTDHCATKDHIELHAELLDLFQEEQGLPTFR